MVKVIDIQETPNPDALKFITDARLVAVGARSFEDARAGELDPLAASIFATGPVASVFYMDRFVTVTKFPGADWDWIREKVQAAIEANAQPVEEKPVAGTGSAESGEILDKINQVLDENIRPALAGDGGGLEVIGYNDFILSVHYQGACGSCPSATAGTLFAIQNLLQRMIDPRIEVVSV